MTFSVCSSYRKDFSDYDEYIAVQHVLDKFEDRMVAFKAPSTRIRIFMKTHLFYPDK